MSAPERLGHKQSLQFQKRSAGLFLASRLWPGVFGISLLLSLVVVHQFPATAAPLPPQASKWDAQLPDGSAKSIVLAKCHSCHTLEKVVVAEHSKDEWKDLMDEMVARGAKLTPNELVSVVDYLTANFSPKDSNTEPTNPTTQVNETSSAASVVDPDRAQFSAPPDSMGFPAGVQISILWGDPAKTGLFSVLLKLPAGTTISARSGTADQNIVCLRGTFEFGQGHAIDQAKLQTVNPGAIAHVPAQVEYFSQAKDLTIILVSGSGPFSTVSSK